MQLTELDTQHSAEERAGSWHALFTRHQHEKSVALALSHKGYEVYLPLYRSLRRWQDREKQVWFPLFPCYVFVREGMDRQLAILTTPGILHIVSWGGRPAIVPLSQLNAVRQILQSCLSVEACPYLQGGDRVLVKGGPLLGLEGILIRQKGAARLVVSLEMLGRSAAVEVDIRDVERIGPRRTVPVQDWASATA